MSEIVTSSEVRITQLDGTITYQPAYTVAEVMEVQNTRRFVKGVGIAKAGGFTNTKRGKDASNDSSVPKRASDDETSAGIQSQGRSK